MKEVQDELLRTGSPERAEDLYQGLFPRIHRAPDPYEPACVFADLFFARRLVVDDVGRAFRAREMSLHGRRAMERLRAAAAFPETAMHAR